MGVVLDKITVFSYFLPKAALIFEPDSFAITAISANDSTARVLPAALEHIKGSDGSIRLAVTDAKSSTNASDTLLKLSKTITSCEFSLSVFIIAPKPFNKVLQFLTSFVG